MIDTSKNTIDNYVDVYLDQNTGKIHLSDPYTSEEDKPAPSLLRHKFLGTGTLKFFMELKCQPKFEPGDEVIIWDEMSALIMAVDPIRMTYTIKVSDNFIPRWKDDYIPGSIAEIDFYINGWMKKKEK